MSYSKIRPRGDLKANWESANPILSAREIGVEWETKIGVGDAKIKFGDGVTAWKNLDYAVVNNITKKIITTFATVSDADPALNAGESLDTILGKIKKKFQYLADNKLNKSAKYDGVDSTSTDLYATANAVRKVNVKADKNASDITTLNNNLGNKGGFRKVILDDTTATDREDLLKKKAKLIYDNQLGDGFYALVGGWAGKGYGFGIAEITSGKIMFLYMLMDTTYKCICDNLPTQSNFVYYQEGIIKAADSFKWNEVEISLPSLAANGGEVFGLTYTIPDSYFENGKWATAAMCGFSLSGNGYTSCTITMCKIIDKNIQYSVKNIGSTALSDIKLKVFIMFART